MIELRRRAIPYRYIDSGQHAKMTQSLRQAFSLPDPDKSLRQAREDIVTLRQAAVWYLKLVWNSLTNRRWLRRHVFPEPGICLVHGDTLSTLLGVQMARTAGIEIAHVEAGLRSFHWFDPFPEELTRMVCMRCAHLLFAPSDEAFQNLRAMRVCGEIIKLSGNTVADALRLMDNASAGLPIPEPPFALATCHRFETITQRSKLRQVVLLLNRVAEILPLLFVTHEPTRKYLQRFKLNGAIHPKIILKDMLDYPDFIAFLKAARFVLTDGGSIQEECAYLQKPCLVLRSKTERADGLDKNAMLWSFDNAIAESFLAKVNDFKPAEPVQLPRPSGQIVDKLVERGYGKNR